jgi:hypothetical protein
MTVQSIASALPSLCIVVAVYAQSLRGLDAAGMPFWGGYNMPLSSDLRSDYPLTLTLLERPHASALKQCCWAGLPSAHAIPVPRISSNRWFLSRPLVDAHHYSGTHDCRYHSVEPRICTRSCTNFCLFACARSASESPNSALSSVAAVHLLSTSGRHSPITTVLCPAF